LRLSGSLIYHFVAFVVVAIWGSTFVFTKLLLLSGLTPAQIFTLRFIIAYVLLLGYSLTRNHCWLSDSVKDELLMMALGVTGGSLYFLTENSSMNGAVVATNYVYFNPVTTILFARVVLSEQITLYFLIGTLLILVGMYLADRKK